MPPAIPRFVATNYEVHQWRHATAVLASDYPAEWREILDVLTRLLEMLLL